MSDLKNDEINKKVDENQEIIDLNEDKAGIDGMDRLIAQNLDYIKNNKHLSYERFDSFSRFLHVLIIVSFLSLAITGMVIKFSGIETFQMISRFLGGYEITGFIHRVGAIITFLYFILHLVYLFRKSKKTQVTFKNNVNYNDYASFKNLIFSKDSLIPNKLDIIQFGQTIKWFLGIGPRPQYGRWTYWEKFDYLAVFWGIAIIGGSGLLLWFPEFFTSIGIPGSVINIATIIHSDEALLAVGFIFTIHFYNTHFRPDKFPIDTVIFTGKVDIDELKYDRPVEYNDLLTNHNIANKLKPEPTKFFLRLSRVFGFSALIIGISIIILIIYSMIFLYE